MHLIKQTTLALVFALTVFAVGAQAGHPLVLQTDFGTKDGAVAAMRGVAVGVDAGIVLHDLSHENTPYDIWEAAYRLKQVAEFWPAGTVFVSVVDPGVGTERKAVVLETKSGHFFVGPDNGTWTLIAEELGVDSMREIDARVHTRPGSERSYTFHGRDLFAFVGAKLAAGKITFAQVGPELPSTVVALPYERAREEGGAVVGTIPALDYQYGNVWTNIGEAVFAKLGVKTGDRVRVTITHDGQTVFNEILPYAHTFGSVPEGAPLLYMNSLMNVAFALNMGDFAKTHGIKAGAAWHVRLEKVR